MIALLWLACGPEDDTSTSGRSPRGALELEVAGLDTSGHAVTLSWRVDPPADVRLVCEAGDDRWETERGPEARELTWHGLLLESTYTCSVQTDAQTATATWTTGTAPHDLPAPSITGHTDGLTLFNHRRRQGAHRLLVIDGEGRLRWSKTLSGFRSLGAESAWIEQTGQGPHFLVGGAEGIAPMLIDMAGREVWSAPESATGGVYHHDTRFTDDGLVVALSKSWVVQGEVGWTGFALETWTAFGEERTWSWEAQQGVDRGQLEIRQLGYDVYHANAVQWLPEDPDGPSFWVSLANADAIVRLDRQTGDITWTLGIGEDFELVDSDGLPASDDDWFHYQHAPEAHLIDPSGVWHLYVYDNGTGRPSGAPHWSRVVLYEVDVPARRATILWDWTEDGWYTPWMGDADLQSNGHILVTRSRGLLEGEPTILEIDPTTDEVVWRATMTRDDDLYRAQRLDPCRLFPDNRTACAP